MFSAAETAPLTTMGSAMFFGTVIFATVALTTKLALAGDWKVLRAAQNPRSSALDLQSVSSVYTLLHHTTVLGLILFYAYLCEYHPPYPHSEKSYDRDEFFFLTALLLVASAFTLQKNDPSSALPPPPPTAKVASPPPTSTNGVVSEEEESATIAATNGVTKQAVEFEESAVAPVNDANEVLNRDQTEEWKGWMQFMFLLYHYLHAEETYNAIRIMITCYVWMTGFGNFSFFYIKGDYGSVRVMQMLWRLNFLVIFLCLTQGTTYILYYICLLHTYFFLMVYATMRIAKHVNYHKWGIRFKLSIVALIIFLIWDVDTGIFQLIHRPFLGDQPMLGATSGAMWEWYFRSSLDHWSTFLGMVFALNFPVTSLFFRKLEAQPLLRHVAAKAAMGAVLLAASFLWVTGPFQLGKFDYNQTNAYFGIVPVLTYIYFRNLTPWLRSHTLDLLHQIGKTTLETYLMQHHIWLTSNAKSLLTLIPGWPKMNFLVVTILYFCASRRLYQLTLFLRGMMLPNNRTACIRNLLGIAVVTASFLGIAGIFELLDMLTLKAVALCSLGLGFLLYQVIVIRLGARGSTTTTTTNNEVQSNASPGFVVGEGLKRVWWAPAAAGTVIVLLVGLFWNHAAEVGAGKIIPLPRSCENAVLQGCWVPVDGCNEGSRGSGYRDYDMASFGTCSALTWGWKATSSSEHCRFARRDAKQLRKDLKHRNVTFVGDSVLRHLYHATCRQLGDASAGAYNTSMEKHSDFSRIYSDVAMEFRWAPFVSNLTAVVDQLLASNKVPDLVVIGGGAWDRLHTYNTAEEQDVMHERVTALAKKLEKLRRDDVPVAWVVPTTINSWALNTEQKRQNIREDQIEDFRRMYRERGIDGAASFVLNGTVFTLDRVEESYDGVHYPLNVYDGGAQIIANAADWLLLESDEDDPFIPPKPGSMDNPFLGLCMLVFAMIGIFTLDGFMGASYIAAIFAPRVAPTLLCEEAFFSLHRRLRLPPFGNADFPAVFPFVGRQRSWDKEKESERGDSFDDGNEMESFLSTSSNNSDKLELLTS